jgi:hypothetical protein
MSIHRVMILPDLMLTGAPRLQRSQAYDRKKTGTPLERHSSLKSGSAALMASALSSLAQVTNATTAPKDSTRRGTNNTTTPALAPKRKKKSSNNKRQASPIPGQGEALQVDNEPDETPRRAYKKPAGRQVPARQQVPSQQPRPATSQAPLGKPGRMERSQRQATGHTTTPFQTTRPPDGQKRDGPAI